jgi:phosphatidylglycerophosphatase A
MSDVRTRHRTTWPTVKWVFSDPGRIMMFGLGSGLFRPGSGTWGTFAAWFLWVVAAPGASDLAIGIFLLAAFLYGCWASGVVGKALNAPDHVGIVWDEFVAFWLVLWLIPNTLSAQILGFILFRFFDVVKPPPIRQVDVRLKGGLGVMADDLLAAGYTLLVMAILIRLGVPMSF